MIEKTSGYRWNRRGWSFVSTSRPLLAAVVVLLLASVILPVAPASARYASLVVDGKSGIELYSRNADTKRYPASLTKIMTLYMAFDALESGKWKLSTRLKVSQRASRQPQTRLGLKAGQTISVREAILALITRSANDVATVVAENHAGTELRFAARMTSQARKLGMSKTTFRNASGLPNRGQLSTARDMVKLATAVQRNFPRYYPYFRTKAFRYKGRVYRNHNKLLGRYAGTEGIKTGYTNASGYNLVASVKRDGTHLIGVVFGGKTGARRDRHMIRLLDRGFKNRLRIAKLSKPPLPLPRPNHDLLVVTNSGGVGDQVEPSISALIAATASSAQGAKDIFPSVIPPEFFTRANNEPVQPAALKHWGIQVGAYSNDGPAHAVIATVRGHLGPAIGHGHERVERVRRRHGTIYRARIMGLREVEARDACAILLSKHLPCVPVPADVEVAAVPANE